MDLLSQFALASADNCEQSTPTQGLGTKSPPKRIAKRIFCDTPLLLQDHRFENCNHCQDRSWPA